MTIKGQMVFLERAASDVAKLVLNNPPLNLVTLETMRQLTEALDEIESDDSVRAVVVAGAPGVGKQKRKDPARGGSRERYVQ